MIVMVTSGVCVCVCICNYNNVVYACIIIHDSNSNSTPTIQSLVYYQLLVVKYSQAFLFINQPKDE